MNKKKGMQIGLGLSCLVTAMVLAVTGPAITSQAKKKVLPKKIKASGNMLDESKMLMSVGEKESIEYSVKPKKTTNKKISFRSSNKKVATVTKKGVVKGVKKGTATITLQSKAKKSVKTKIKVTVQSSEPAETPTTATAQTYLTPNIVNPNISPVQGTLPVYLAYTSITGITLDRTYIELAAGESDRLTATFVPVISTDEITWSIDHLGGINVYQDGRIFVTDDTPVGTTAVITAYSGKVKATCTIVVVQGPCDHDWSDWTITTEATCMAEGIHMATCNLCGKTREEPIPATGHSWLERIISEPTCVEVGEVEYTCQHCNEIKQELVNAKGHTWSAAGEILEEPTCTKVGSMKYTCLVTDCGGEKTEPIPALGHSWNNGEITKSPTCTGTGTRTYTCTIEGCTGTMRENVDPIGHTWTYGEITQEPGCTTPGKRLCTCLNCNGKTTVTLPSTGHNWDNGVRTAEPTCVLQGTMTYTCSTCLATRTSGIPPLGHSVGDYVTDVEATCSKPGTQSKHCQRAGCTYRSDIRKLTALGHDYDDGVITIAPNCINAGVKTYSCKRTPCDAKKRELLPALGHDWTDDYVIDVEPTCTATGKKSFHCQRDNCTSTRFQSLVPALGHDWDVANVVTVAATCTKDGTNTYTCKRDKTDADGNKVPCGIQMIEILEATGHNYSADYTLDKTPSCVVAGRKSRHCTNTYVNAYGVTLTCSSVVDDTIVEPVGHKWNYTVTDAWMELVAPTHGVPGLEVRTCNSCSAEQKRGKVAEHAYDKDGNCTNCGVTVALTKSTIKDWEYTLNETEGTVLLRKYVGTTENLLIPEKMNVTVDGKTKEYQVTFAGKYEPRTSTGVFASNKKCQIKAISFEDTVQLTDMQYMFYGCEALETVIHIPSTVTNVLGTFKGCTALKYVGKLPDTLIELPNTFEDCSSLAVAPVVPATVTNLYATFKNCEAMSVAPALPDGLTNLNWTFSGCTQLYEAPALPATVTEMTNTFEGCENLTRVPEDIPAGVEELTMTFYACNTLEVVPKLPVTILSMKYTFKNCKNLTYAAPLPKGLEEEVDVFVGCDNLED